jgi:hypothetical protein
MNINLSEQFRPNRGRMKTHAIRWKFPVSGKIGTGTKLFEKEEAEHLAKDLNYPKHRSSCSMQALNKA